MLMKGLRRAGTGAGWVKCWECKTLPCAAGMLGMQHPVPLLVPHDEGDVEGAGQQWGLWYQGDTGRVCVLQGTCVLTTGRPSCL